MQPRRLQDIDNNLFPWKEHYESEAGKKKDAGLWPLNIPNSLTLFQKLSGTREKMIMPTLT